MSAHFIVGVAGYIIQHPHTRSKVKEIYYARFALVSAQQLMIDSLHTHVRCGIAGRAPVTSSVLIEMSTLFNNTVLPGLSGLGSEIHDREGGL